jgi:SM-20-related protein
MPDNFNELIDSFIANGIGITPHFLNPVLCVQLKENIKSLLKQNLMQQAGMGNDFLVTKDNFYRNDKIYWLDRKHDNISENTFLDMIDLFVTYLNSTCYTGITGYEFHYAVYEKGNFYHKHLDQFKNNDSRKYSMIFYLNEDWIEGDGGELCVHRNNLQQHITPTSGKGVFFQSNIIEHEVLVCNKTRISITGWLKVG